MAAQLGIELHLGQTWRERQWRRVARNIGFDFTTIYLCQRSRGLDKRAAYAYAKRYQIAQRTAPLPVPRAFTRYY